MIELIKRVMKFDVQNMSRHVRGCGGVISSFQLILGQMQSCEYLSIRSPSDVLIAKSLNRKSKQ